MIDNRELRIGNLVTLSGSLILTVYEIHEDCFYAKDAKKSSFKSTWADLQPISLSEEVLLKCGFEKEFDEDGRYIYNSNICAYIIDETFDDYDVGVRHVSNVNYFSWGLKNLHQLQNLYYVITGEELEVKWN